MYYEKYYVNSTSLFAKLEISATSEALTIMLDPISETVVYKILYTALEAVTVVLISSSKLETPGGTVITAWYRNWSAGDTVPSLVPFKFSKTEKSLIVTACENNFIGTYYLTKLTQLGNPK